MATDRVKIEDEVLERELDKVDWGKLVQYGKIEVTVRNGEWTAVTKHPTMQKNPRRQPG